MLTTRYFPNLLDPLYYLTIELPCIVEYLGLDKCHIIANNWGTVLAQYFVLNANQKSKKITIVSIIWTIIRWRWWFIYKITIWCKFIKQLRIVNLGLFLYVQFLFMFDFIGCLRFSFSCFLFDFSHSFDASLPFFFPYICFCVICYFYCW